MTTQIFTIEQTAKMYNTTVERIKEQYAANAQGLEKMYNKAIATGKEVNGYTAEYLKAKVEEYKKLAE